MPLEHDASRLRRLERHVEQLTAELGELRARVAQGQESDGGFAVVELVETLERGSTAEGRVLARLNTEWVEAGMAPVTVEDALSAVGPIAAGKKLGTWRDVQSDRFIALFRCP